MKLFKFVICVGVSALLLFGVSEQVCLAQESVDSHVSVGANARTRSAVFDLLSTSQLTATLEAAPSKMDGTVRVYVFDESGVLRGLDDPEVVAGSFSFHPPHAGYLCGLARHGGL